MFVKHSELLFPVCNRCYSPFILQIIKLLPGMCGFTPDLKFLPNCLWTQKFYQDIMTNRHWKGALPWIWRWIFIKATYPIGHQDNVWHWIPSMYTKYKSGAQKWSSMINGYLACDLHSLPSPRYAWEMVCPGVDNFALLQKSIWCGGRGSCLTP